MNEILKSILKSLGISDTHIAEMEKAVKLTEEEAKTYKSDTLINEIKEHLKLLNDNDAELREKVETEVLGKHYAIFDRELKKHFGITDEEMKDKKVADKMKLVKEKLTANNDKDIKTLQEENLQLSNTIKKLQDEDIPKIKGETETYKKDFQFERSVESLLSGIKLKTKPAIILPVLKSALKENYDTDISGANIVLYNKDSKIQPKNKAGNGILTAKDYIMDWLNENELIEKTLETGKTKVIVSDGKDNSITPFRRHIEEAEAHQKEMEASIQKK